MTVLPQRILGGVDAADKWLLWLGGKA